MIRFATIAALSVLFAAPAHALMVSVETALICPELEDFEAVASGTDVPGCARVEKHMDLYGPVGRAPKAPGGPFVRVRFEDRLYWAEEQAFYRPAPGVVPGDPGLAGASVPLPPAE